VAFHEIDSAGGAPHRRTTGRRTRGSWIGGVRTATCTFGRPGEKLTAFVQP